MGDENKNIVVPQEAPIKPLDLLLEAFRRGWSVNYDIVEAIIRDARTRKIPDRSN
jgi:hypothetical protein